MLPGRTRTRSNFRRMVLFIPLGLLLAWVPPATAQGPSSGGVYHPLDTKMTPGLAGRWAAQLGPAGAVPLRYFQPVEVRLVQTGPAGGGRVTWFDGPARRAVPVAAPAAVGLLVGEIYRLQISDMAAFPGVSLYPTIEILDRLHPPAGRRYQFPVPVELTDEDIRLALQGHLVTRVVFLEEPRLSGGTETTTPTMVRDRSPEANLLAEADRVGRPMLVVRLGGRLPPVRNVPGMFFGNGASIEFPPKTPPASVSRIRAADPDFAGQNRRRRSTDRVQPGQNIVRITGGNR
ncbi:MAG: hypothetical protein QF363_17445 [Planctomycetaceae bacterium]|nr:hypothetical protein [Planctomycetaceae bacterium]